ncbi:MAG: TlyA family RNA methyltransferase [Candidatus Paceibacterota bacterium]
MKKRIDILLFEKGLAKSRHAGSELIKAQRITVDGKIIQKNSEQVDLDSKIEIIGTEKQYVGRGGLKLEKALLEFKIDPSKLIALDVGSSTGGFTECLLRQGAKKVYAVDVGTDQFDADLKKDPKIILMEKTDIRKVEKLPEEIDLAVIDVSFISLELVLESVKNLVKQNGLIIALIKPQFETKKEEKNKSGIVKTKESRESVLKKIGDFSEKIGLKIMGIIDSPILGGSGNKEYFILLQN